MANKKQSKEKLAKRRLAKRKKYAELKENKELYAIEREKERLRYLKRKEAKKIVSIADKSPRAQREQRKKWRENKGRSLKKKEELKKVQEVFVNNDNMCNAVRTTTEVKDPLSINVIINNNIQIKKQVGTQTNEGVLIDAMVYRRNADKTRFSFVTDILHKIDFHNQRPKDDRNENFARLVAFELEKVPEERRSYLYPQILNLIRLFRGDSDLDECFDFVPIISDSDFVEKDEKQEVVLPLNVRYEKIDNN